MAATVLASLPSKPHQSSDEIVFRQQLARMSDHAKGTYQRLVYGNPGLREFFFSATPINEIAELRIGSRPSSRKNTNRIEDLRAIPWVFAWAQARIMLPGWFGVGSALASCADREVLREMVENWPFFSATLSNLEMVLAKSDMVIARKYADLVPARGLREEIFNIISDEWHRTRDQLLLLTRQARLLDRKPELQRSIDFRLPYVEPLNELQIELIRRRRMGDSHSDVREGIHLTVNAIVAGLRNSG